MCTADLRTAGKDSLKLEVFLVGFHKVKPKGLYLNTSFLQEIISNSIFNASWRSVPFCGRESWQSEAAWVPLSGVSLFVVQEGVIGLGFEFCLPVLCCQGWRGELWVFKKWEHRGGDNRSTLAQITHRPEQDPVVAQTPQFLCSVGSQGADVQLLSWSHFGLI